MSDQSTQTPPQTPPPATSPLPAASSSRTKVLRIKLPLGMRGFTSDGVTVTHLPTPVPADKADAVVEAAKAHGIKIEEVEK
jgi:hypothetical protein